MRRNKKAAESNLKVDCLVIGAGRSGTTSLCSFLEAQDDVCFSVVKEVHYFSIPDLFRRGEQYYHSFFQHNKAEKVVVSADTYLMIDYEAIERIYQYNPQMKIVVLLRNPVSRAFSSYNYSVNYGHHQRYESFLDSIAKETAIEKEANIVDRNNFGHFYAGLYAKHLGKWVKKFGKEQVLVLKTSDLKDNQDQIKKELSSFLGISYPEGYLRRENANAVPRNQRFEKMLLDRDRPLRRIVRNVVPGFVKRQIIHSGVIDKMHDMNRVQGSDAQAQSVALTEEEYEAAMQYFEDDLQQLSSEYGVDL